MVPARRFPPPPRTALAPTSVRFLTGSPSLWGCWDALIGILSSRHKQRQAPRAGLGLQQTAARGSGPLLAGRVPQRWPPARLFPLCLPRLWEWVLSPRSSSILWVCASCRRGKISHLQGTLRKRPPETQGHATGSRSRHRRLHRGRRDGRRSRSGRKAPGSGGWRVTETVRPAHGLPPTPASCARRLQQTRGGHCLRPHVPPYMSLLPKTKPLETRVFLFSKQRFDTAGYPKSKATTWCFILDAKQRTEI